jgi:DNA-binding beta-propeller fold protein YncE
MRKLTLVSVQTVALVASLLAATGAWAHTTEGDAKFGTQIALPGIINDVVVDELRRMVYAANFTAGRVDVVSMDTQQRISSFPTTPQPAATSGIAISPNGRWLLATSHPVTSGVPQQSSVTVVNLDDTSDRRHFAFTEQPLGVAFQSDNKAVIITDTNLREFDPVDGSLKVLFTFEEAVGTVILPIAPPTLPRSIIEANISASADGKWIFGIAPEFVFSYQVMSPVGLLRIRLTTSLVNPPDHIAGEPACI